jgi:hypothetical protein
MAALKAQEYLLSYEIVVSAARFLAIYLGFIWYASDLRA